MACTMFAGSENLGASAAALCSLGMLYNRSTPLAVSCEKISVLVC